MNGLSRPTLSLIVAVADNGVIGCSAGGHLGMPWRIASEFAYFKKTTMGFPVIHGRKSFAALGKPLPGRLNIVITRDPGFQAAGIEVAHSLQDAVTIAEKSGAAEVFICGGAEIYKQALPMVDKLYYTEVHLQPEGDVHFPDFNKAEWQETKREFHKAVAGEDGDYTITVLVRKR